MFPKKSTNAIWRVPYTWSKYFLKPSLLQCVLSAADDFSATVVAAAAVITPAAAVQAAVVAETDMLQEDEEWFLLSIQASLLLLARSLRLLLGGRFFLPCLWELPAAVVAAAVAAAPGWRLQKKLYSSSPPLVSNTSLAQIPLATQSLYSCKMWAERGGECLLAGPGGVCDGGWPIGRFVPLLTISAQDGGEGGGTVHSTSATLVPSPHLG